MAKPEWIMDYAIVPSSVEKPERYDGRILVPFCVESEYPA